MACRSLALCLILWPSLCGALQIAILMQGSDFINVSVVPTLGVNQFDLGDVYLSPCREGTFSPDHSGVCRDCTTCQLDQYDPITCTSVRDRVCKACTVCSPRQQEVCACGPRTDDCPLANRICAPLPVVSVNISFQVGMAAPMSTLQQKFFQQGMDTGFRLYLGSYLGLSTDNIVLSQIYPLNPTMYYLSYILNDVYSIYTTSQIRAFSESTVQQGLVITFGSIVNTGRRRSLLQFINLLASGVTKSCSAPVCESPFFIITGSVSACNATCTPIPCPAGYTGIKGDCGLCGNGTYKGTEGNDTCTDCPMNYTSNQGSVSVDSCRPPPTTSVVITSTAVTTPAVTPYLGITSVGVSAVGTSRASTALASSQTSIVAAGSSARTSTTIQVTQAQTTTVQATPAPSTSPAPPAPPPPSQGGGGNGGNSGNGGQTIGTQYVVGGDMQEYVVAGNMQEIRYNIINEAQEPFPVESFAVAFLFLAMIILSYLAYHLVEGVRPRNGNWYEPVPGEEERPRVLAFYIHTE